MCDIVCSDLCDGPHENVCVARKFVTLSYVSMSRMLNAIMSTALVPDLARYTNVFCKIRFRYLHFLINYGPTFFIIY